MEGSAFREAQKLTDPEHCVQGKEEVPNSIVEGERIPPGEMLGDDVERAWLGDKAQARAGRRHQPPARHPRAQHRLLLAAAAARLLRLSREYPVHSVHSSLPCWSWPPAKSKQKMTTEHFFPRSETLRNTNNKFGALIITAETTDFFDGQSTLYTRTYGKFFLTNSTKPKGPTICKNR